MFKVEAIIRPAALEDGMYGLDALGCDDVVVSNVQGDAERPTATACYRGVKYDRPLVQQLRVEVCVTETMLEAVIDRIVNTAHTGQPGDGKIFVSALSDVIDIGGESSLAANVASATPRPRLAVTAASNWPSNW